MHYDMLELLIVFFWGKNRGKWKGHAEVTVNQSQDNLLFTFNIVLCN